jgi:hypothetical protein
MLRERSDKYTTHIHIQTHFAHTIWVCSFVTRARTLFDMGLS